MNFAEFASTICSLLLNYFVHSTLILAIAWFVLRYVKWVASPWLALQAWKMALLAPVVTAFGVTFMSGPHFGLEFSLMKSRNSGPYDAVEPVVSQSTPSDLGVKLLEGQDDDADVLAAKSMAFVAGSDQSPSIESRVGASEKEEELRFSFLYTSLFAFWLIVAMARLFSLWREWTKLQALRQSAVPVESGHLQALLKNLCKAMRYSHTVKLYWSSRVHCPLAAGMLQPFVLLPSSGAVKEVRFKGSEVQAILGHELAHLVHRDALWNLIAQVVCRLGFFQPLNYLASREIRKNMDFVADGVAALVLGDRLPLATCLVRFAEIQNRYLSREPAPTFVSGIAEFDSTLGCRISLLLDERVVLSPPSLRSRLLMGSSLACLSLLLAFTSPRIVHQIAPSFPKSSPPSPLNEQVTSMKSRIASMILSFGLTAPVVAEGGPVPHPETQDQTSSPKNSAAKLPEGIRGFNGMLVGRLEAKDPEAGTFTIQVDAVSRVWENSRAENPRSIVGKTVSINGVFGRFLDVLVVTRVGETVEFECKFDDGRLLFPGELLRKVGPYKAEEYPVLPDAFRGFSGVVAAEVLSKDPETFELVLRVNEVRKVSDENKAKEPKSVEGKSVSLIGFWNRREVFNEMKVGSKIEVGMRHKTPTSDHLDVIEGVRTLKGAPEQAGSGEMQNSERGRMQDGSTRGFRGMLVGRLVEKDVERGTFTVTVDAVPRVWEKNQFDKPKSLIGRNVKIEGVDGRLIDALVVARTGETLEFGAFHDGGEKLRVGEVLHKVAPVKPGDYPVPPEEFRGFRGVVLAKVVRKSIELHDLVVEVEKIEELFDGNQADKPQSIVGKQLLLGGFWNRKEAFHDLQVGDRIRCGMIHRQVLSDHLDAVEVLQKVDKQ